ncbi:MAG: LysR family transcriptional regulator [Gammaproteobacteria bacterium]
MDKFNSMHVFCRIVELGSFIAVAREMDLSPMMISKHVAQLEKALGVSLLNRTTRKVSLTEAGSQYYRRSKQILEDLMELEDQTSELANTVKGLLRISVPIDFGGIHLVPAIDAYQKRYPDVAVQMSLDNGPVNLTDGSFDMAVRVTDVLDPGIVARKFTETQLGLYASPGYLRQHGMPKHVDDLMNHRCLRYLDTPHGDFWVFNEGGKIKKIKPKTHFASNNGRALGQAAALGMGIVQAPELSVARYLENGSLMEILPDCKPQKIFIYAIYPQRRFVPAKLSTFVNYLIEYFKF